MFGEADFREPGWLYLEDQPHLAIMNPTENQHPQDKSQVRVLTFARSAVRTEKKNTSIQRQTRATRKWCESQGYQLNESDELVDEGVSGYSGVNYGTGKLSVLTQQLESGEIAPGSMLIVESFERISREGVKDTAALLFSLISKGLILVTVIDGRISDMNSLSDLTPFMMSVATAHLEYEKSLMRSLRIRAGLEAKRAKRSLQT